MILQSPMVLYYSPFHLTRRSSSNLWIELYLALTRSIIITLLVNGCFKIKEKYLPCFKLPKLLVKPTQKRLSSESGNIRWRRMYQIGMKLKWKMELWSIKWTITFTREYLSRDCTFCEFRNNPAVYKGCTKKTKSRKKDWRNQNIDEYPQEKYGGDRIFGERGLKVLKVIKIFHRKFRLWQCVQDSTNDESNYLETLIEERMEIEKERDMDNFKTKKMTL